MAKKEAIVYDRIGLPNPLSPDRDPRDFLNLGSILPVETGSDTVVAVMNAYIDLIEQAQSSLSFDPDVRTSLVLSNFIRFDAYVRLFKAYKGFSRETAAAENLLKPENREVKRDLAERRNPFANLDTISEILKTNLRRHFDRIEKATPETYWRLLQQSELKIADFLNRPMPFAIAQQEFERHVLLTGNSGAGKSTLLERLARVCAANEQASVVLVDPAGTLARAIAQLPEFAGSQADRLIYIDPTLAPDRTPVLNPLDLRDRSESAVHIATENLVATFEELLKAGNGADLTLNMRALLYPCISTLIQSGDKTLYDLQRFLQNDPALLAEGRRSSHDGVRRFFETAYEARKFEPTKLSLFTKLQSLLNSQTFARVVARPRSSVDLEQEVNNGKVIVVNLAKGAMGGETSEALGRFVIAALKGMVQKRWSEPGRPKSVFLVIDEVQNYLSPSIVEILRESRKFGLHMVAATQYISDLDRSIQDAFLSVTNVKISGKNSIGTLTTMAKETGAEIGAMQNLRQGKFSIKVDTARPVTVTVPPPEPRPDTRDRHAAWKRTVADQLERYYKPLVERPEHPAGPEGPEPQATPLRTPKMPM